MAAERPLPVTDEEAAGLFCGLGGEHAIALAVSGGPDSLALAALMTRWAGALAQPPKLHALVVDHGLRAGSAAEAARTRDTLRRLGIDAAILALSGLPAANLHAAARLARYDAMTDWMALNGFGLLVTAHHRDDQAETVAMRMARDPQAGVAGIPASGWWADRRLARPLLGIAKSRLAATVRAMGLDPVIDPSNDDPRFERARVRRQIAGGRLPVPVSRLFALSDAACRAQDERDMAAWKLAGAALRLLPQGIALLDADRYAQADCGIRRWMLRSLVRDMGANTVPPRRDKLDRLEARLAGFACGERGGGFPGATLSGVRFQRAVGRDRGRLVAIFREAGRGTAPVRALAPDSAMLFDRRFRIVCAGGKAIGGMRVSALAGRLAGETARGALPGALPAAALAAVPWVFGAETPLFPLVSQRAVAAGISACWCGLRYGKSRLAPAC